MARLGEIFKNQVWPALRRRGAVTTVTSVVGVTAVMGYWLMAPPYITESWQAIAAKATSPNLPKDRELRERAVAVLDTDRLSEVIRDMPRIERVQWRSTGAIFDVPPDRFYSQVRDIVATEYRQGDLIDLDGWLVSKTEAKVLAATALE